MSRAERKKDHINYALTNSVEQSNSFDDVHFVHNSLPETSVSNIDVSVMIGELPLSSPIIINAMTGGGGTETEVINGRLAAAAKNTGVAMAVGSQMAALKDSDEKSTYQTVRNHNKEGIIFSNLGSELTINQAEQAVEMLQADALQIHLNVIQELVMPEGDRDFQGALDRIIAVADAIDVPVIVKEVGFGLSRDAVKKLTNSGIQVVDTGGNGGTNFSSIENERRTAPFRFFDEWGISTVSSIVESVQETSSLSVIGSGGVRNGSDIAKAIALGADAAGMAGNVLAAVQQGGQKGAEQFLERCLEELKMIMAAVGAENIFELKKAPIVVTGSTREWLTERGIDTKEYSKRNH
ncbi:type 2 isopentenyl-diphosphate Delta-isomerase [Salibacterium salarium]|uniref:Isopentenyl-diphosphate delta-isomerase n=1 Tax=Salibacterium salarium TaxID=284579 RepID=A0A428N4S1_9BACI|nr:type 2 isopentenyl-diphosphate Delta-isomerase [Salibacterium salarium]RSL33480.1 type 2 isopentenyl-diphosphate Delta-isomerase [Salibacterium salarium]